MRLNRFAAVAAVALVAVPSALWAAPVTYTDAHGEQVGSTNKARDIWSASIDDDGSNFIITINLDPGATLGTVTFDYGIGITAGPGANGDTSANATTHGNPYQRALSIDSSLGGMTDWIGLFPAGGAGTAASPWTSYGFNDYTWSSTTGAWTKVNTVSSGQPMVTQGGNAGLSSITVTVPLSNFANLDLSAGKTIYFDIYSTGTSAGQTAYDSLVDTLPTNSSNSSTAQFNGLTLDSYTMQGAAAVLPEPLASTVALPGLAVLCRPSRRRAARR